MPKRVSPEEVKQMFRLFEKYGNYVRVAEAMGRSPSTIGRYIRGGKDAPQMLKHVEKQVIGKQ